MATTSKRERERKWEEGAGREGKKLGDRGKGQRERLIDREREK